MKPLNGKVTLVAGATRGAGRGIAIELGAVGVIYIFIHKVKDLFTFRYCKKMSALRPIKI